MKIKYVLIILLIIIIISISCDNYTHNTITNTNPINLVNLEFKSTFGGDGIDIGTDVITDENRNHYISGTTTSFGIFGEGGSNASLYKTDPGGNLLWQTYFGGYGEETSESVFLQGDSSVFIAGLTTSFDIITGKKLRPRGSPDYDWDEFNFYLVKIDRAGTYGWEKAYGTSELDEKATAAVMVSDGIVISGYTSKLDDNQLINIYIIKTDFEGILSWAKTHGTNKAEWTYSIAKTSDGGFILGGYTDDENSRLKMPYMLKLNSTGSMLWQKEYSGSNFDRRIYSVIEVKDGYVSCGKSIAYDGGAIVSSGIYILKVDFNGNRIWEYTFSQYNLSEAKSIVELNDGTFLIASNNFTDGKIAITKIDENGIFMWSQADVHGTGECIIPFDNSFLITGSTDNSGPITPPEVLLIKFSEDKTNLEF